jgi:microcystin degradation protein MlrC
MERQGGGKEHAGVLAASFFVGFPHADIPYAGSSAVVVTDGDPKRAQALCDELLDMAWQAREQFVYRIEPLEQSLRRAQQLRGEPGRPVVLLDHYDNCASGGTMDTMAVLAAILEAGLENVAAFAICDPQAVEQMKIAGVGARVTLQLGGKLDMPALGLKGLPPRLRRCLCDKLFRRFLLLQYQFLRLLPVLYQALPALFRDLFHPHKLR